MFKHPQRPEHLVASTGEILNIGIVIFPVVSDIDAWKKKKRIEKLCD